MVESEMAWHAARCPVNIEPLIDPSLYPFAQHWLELDGRTSWMCTWGCNEGLRLPKAPMDATLLAALHHCNLSCLTPSPEVTTPPPQCLLMFTNVYRDVDTYLLYCEAGDGRRPGCQYSDERRLSTLRE